MPVESGSEVAAALLRGLDAAQVEAVTTDASPLAVIAAAGSGKTTVLTRRIAHRVLTGSVAPRHVLALTFTRDAAGELKRRLRRFDLRTPIEAGTFHSVTLRLLRDRAEAAGQAPPVVAVDRLRLVREVLTELRMRADAAAVAADIDWARARLVVPDGYERALRSTRRRSAIPIARYAEVIAAYEQLKRRRGVVDFDDLLDRVATSLESDPAWAEAVRWRFRHLFVDEAQDLNPLQHKVLEGIRGGRPDLCLVGDPRQSIYGWNGADHRLLADVGEHYPGITVVRLERNYRCSPQVVRAGAAALRASGQSDDSASDQPDGRRLSIERHADETDEARAVAQHIRQLLLQRPGRDLAVLARTNEQLTVVDQHLADLGIATERSAGRSPLHAAIRAATSCTSREQLAAWVDRALAAARHADDGAAADDDLGDARSVGDSRAQHVEMLVATEADRFLTSGESGTFRAWLEARAPFDELLAEQRSEAVSLLTFHAAKGREWWGVVVVGVEEGFVPHASATTRDQVDEEARLFYVALTRAEQHLHVTYAANRGTRATSPSRWLDAVSETAALDAPAPPPAAWRRRRVDPLADLKAWRASVARSAGVDERSLCSDQVLQSLADVPPADAVDLAGRLGITVTAAQRLKPLPGVDTDAR